MIRALWTRLKRKTGARRLRQLMRGHRGLRETGRLALIDDIKHDLAHCPAPQMSPHLTKLLFGDRISDYETSIQQYMIIRLAYLPLTHAILRHMSGQAGAFVYPMPLAWRRVLERHGITVAHHRSAIWWLGYGVALWGYGTLSIGRQLIRSLRPRPSALGANANQTAYFDQLSAANLPSKQSSSSYDILSWFSQWPDRKTQLHADIQALAHAVPGGGAFPKAPLPIFKIHSPVDLALPGTQRRAFAWWGLRSSLAVLWAVLRGQGIAGMMLFEAGKRASIAHTPADQICAAYLFHNSGWIYRPLWTFEAEAKGAQILFYFYSTNCEDFKQPQGYGRQSNQWDLSRWPTCLVWTQRQADFIAAHTPHAKTCITGPIWFSGTGHFDAPPGPKIALFDVQPMRSSLYQGLGLKFDYYTPATTLAFLEDLYAVCQTTGATGLLKRKRDVGKHLHPAYQRFLNQLNGSEHILEIPPHLAAQTVIAQSDLVVSMPFTSTALIARDMDKPSCFFDPLALLQPDDRAAHGIPIVQSREALHKWVNIHLERRGARSDIRAEI